MELASNESHAQYLVNIVGVDIAKVERSAEPGQVTKVKCDTGFGFGVVNIIWLESGEHGPIHMETIDEKTYECGVLIIDAAKCAFHVYLATANSEGERSAGFGSHFLLRKSASK